MTIGSGSKVVASDGRELTLAELLNSGGAGSIYRIAEAADLVAKIYHPQVDHAVYQRKVEAMLVLKPDLPDLVDGDAVEAQLAWPRTLLLDQRRRFLGFAMPLLDFKTSVELECVMQERQARTAGLPTGLGPRLTLAANLAGVVAELHRQGHFVVDLKPTNLRFYRRSLHIAMLDCDGLSIKGTRERFRAPQYTPEYLAPELHGRALAEEDEEPLRDLPTTLADVLSAAEHLDKDAINQELARLSSRRDGRPGEVSSNAACAQALKDWELKTEWIEKDASIAEDVWVRAAQELAGRPRQTPSERGKCGMIDLQADRILRIQELCALRVRWPGAFPGEGNVACRKHGVVEEGIHLFEARVLHGRSVDSHTWGWLAQAFLVAGDTPKAEESYLLMVWSGRSRFGLRFFDYLPSVRERWLVSRSNILSARAEITVATVLGETVPQGASVAAQELWPKEPEPKSALPRSKPRRQPR
jgi:hypothetical protein